MKLTAQINAPTSIESKESLNKSDAGVPLIQLPVYAKEYATGAEKTPTIKNMRKNLPVPNPIFPIQTPSKNPANPSMPPTNAGSRESEDAVKSGVE